MSLPIRAVIFDIGGVFFPWPQPSFFEDWEARQGLAPGQLEPRLWYGPDIEAANIGAITAEEYTRRSAARLDADEANVGDIIETAFGGGPLNADLAAYARTLRSRARVAALTNTWSFGRALIERRGIADLFDLILISAEEGVRKPAPRIYEIALERLMILPAEAVFVDDTAENVVAAQRLGMHGILFHSTVQAIATLDALFTLEKHQEGVEQP
jgi:epoxide hydrolase-like predicted phosphatase